MTYYIKNDELYHYGIKGMKWYIRRFQNPDGTLTEAGKRRYYTLSESNKKRWDKVMVKDLRRNMDEAQSRLLEDAVGVNAAKQSKKRAEKNYSDLKDSFSKTKKGIFKSKKSVNDLDESDLDMLYGAKKLISDADDKYKERIERLSKSTSEYEQYRKNFEEHANRMIEKYGNSRLSSYSTEKIKIGDDFLMEVIKHKESLSEKLYRAKVGH